MSVSEYYRSWWLDSTILQNGVQSHDLELLMDVPSSLLSRYGVIQKQHLQEGSAYPTHNSSTASTFCHHIPGALPALAIVVTAGVPQFFHVEPVASPGTVSKGIIGVELDVLELAVEGVRL